GTPSVTVANFPATSGREVVQRSHRQFIEPHNVDAIVQLYGPVPTGKRLVIEFVGASMVVPGGQHVDSLTLFSGDGGQVVIDPTELAGISRSMNDSEKYTVNQQLRYY